jgi:transposase
MARKCIEVNLQGFTIELLQLLADEIDNNYSRIVLQTIIMRAKDITPKQIASILGKSHPTITTYIHRWNEDPLKAIKDERGNNIPSELTDEIMLNVTTVIMNESPSTFGYEKSRWDSRLISQYIEDKYGKKFGFKWITKLLKNQGFSYKRGMYTPTKGDPELQAQFKKNDSNSGFN